MEGVCSLRLCKGRQSAERSSRRRVGCHLSVSVSCRTRSRRPTVFRPLPENSDKGKDFKIWGVVRRTLPYSAPVFGKSMAQTPGQALFAGNKAVFNASFCFRLRRKAVYQRSGAPGQPSGGRAAGHKQPRFTRGVKRHAHRAGPAPCTVCPALTGVCVTQAMARSCPAAGHKKSAGQGPRFSLSCVRRWRRALFRPSPTSPRGCRRR